jgi:hypothetical protein
MRTTVDIPDEVFRAVKVMAAEQGATVRELVLEGLEMVMRTRKAARMGLGSREIPSAKHGTLEVDQESSDELIGFP